MLDDFRLWLGWVLNTAANIVLIGVVVFLILWGAYYMSVNYPIF